MQYFRDLYRQQAAVVRGIQISWTDHAPVIRWVVRTEKLVVATDLIARAFATGFIFLTWLHFSRQKEQNAIGSINLDTAILLVGGAVHWSFPMNISFANHVAATHSVANMLLGLMDRLKRFVSIYIFLYQKTMDKSKASEMIQVSEILRCFLLVYCGGGGILANAWQVIYRDYRDGLICNISQWIGLSFRNEGVDAGNEQVKLYMTDPWTEFAYAVLRFVLPPPLSALRLYFLLPQFLTGTVAGFSVKVFVWNWIRMYIVDALVNVGYFVFLYISKTVVSAGYLEPLVDRNLPKLQEESLRANQARRAAEENPSSRVEL